MALRRSGSLRDISACCEAARPAIRLRAMRELVAPIEPQPPLRDNMKIAGT